MRMRMRIRIFRDYVILEFKGLCIFKRMRMRMSNLRIYVILEFYDFQEMIKFKGFIFKRMRMRMRNENLRDYVILEFQ